MVNYGLSDQNLAHEEVLYNLSDSFDAASVYRVSRPAEHDEDTPC